MRELIGQFRFRAHVLPGHWLPQNEESTWQIKRYSYAHLNCWRGNKYSNSNKLQKLLILWSAIEAGSEGFFCKTIVEGFEEDLWPLLSTDCKEN